MAEASALIHTRQIHQPGNREALMLWYKTNLSLVRGETSVLSARQLVVLLVIAMEKGPHTVKGLAEHLHISKPAICRALDTLSRLKLTQRMVDQEDRRNIFVIPTEAGIHFLATLSETIMNNLMEIQ
jgi:DNA-binding MarR family transcriptional regulator